MNAAFATSTPATNSATPSTASDPAVTILSLAEARQRIDAAIAPLAACEDVPLSAALDRVLASDLVSHVQVPGHDNSAMDGYALHSRYDGTKGLRVIGESRAGRPYAGPVGDQECVRIFTGAVMPDDCDAVIPQEQVAVDADGVTIEGTVSPGQHRRLAGEDLAVGAITIARGRKITPSDLGLAASIGRDVLTVVRRPRVAVFSTGNELRDLGAPLERGSIRDSNRYTLIGMLTRLGMEAIDLGIVGDDPVALDAALVAACGVGADAVITSGGVSAGDADHTRDVMRRAGDVAFWKLAIKPGRPMAFGLLAHGGRSIPMFGLPGNPVATMVVFHALVRDAMLKLAGARVEPVPSITAVCETAIPKSSGRTEFVRAIATRDAHGWRIRPTGLQGSGILRSMSEANCLIVLDHDRGPVAAGETVEAWPFQGLG
ncbi:MAG: gephyrin-like molybdotransferase Glp [Burkholderiaceae bacterium]